MNKRLLLIAIFVLSILKVNAQKDNVTLVVSGTGATKEEATMNALRSAIEQTYGTFVSENTQLLNDELVRDEVVTVSSGNIKQYKEIAHSILENGNHFMTLYATVSISKLMNYAQSKGATTVEFNGASIGMNYLLKKLYEKNKRITIENMFTQLSEIPDVFDMSLSLVLDDHDRKYENDHKVKFTINLKYNANTELFIKTIYNTLAPLAVREYDWKQFDLKWWIYLERESQKYDYIAGQHISIIHKILTDKLENMRIGIKANTGEIVEFGPLIQQSNREPIYFFKFYSKKEDTTINGKEIGKNNGGGILDVSNLRGGFDCTSIDTPYALDVIYTIRQNSKGWWIDDIIRRGNYNKIGGIIGELRFDLKINPSDIGKYSNFELVILEKPTNAQNYKARY